MAKLGPDDNSTLSLQHTHIYIYRYIDMPVASFGGLFGGSQDGMKQRDIR